MPCVSVRNNHARKARVKAANIERKNNRKATQAAKKQQKVATAEAKLQARAESRAAAVQAKIVTIQAKTAAKSAKQTSKATTKTARQTVKSAKKAAKTRQSLEKRVLKKHQSHRAKTKTAQAKALKAQAKSAKLQTRKATQAAAKTAKTQAKVATAEKRIQAKAALKTAKSTTKLARTAARAEKISKVKTQIKTSVKSIKLPKLPKPTLPNPTLPKLKKTAHAKTEAASKTTPQDASRVAKISGAGVQNSLKINHAAASQPSPLAAFRNLASASAPQEYSPKPLRRTAFMTKDDLINAESRLGSTIFGPIPAGHRREFFHDQENIWIWFESWHDETGRPHQLTVRYEVRTSGIYKKISAGAYFKLAGDELENFRRATHAYLGLIKKYLYPHVATVK